MSPVSRASSSVRAGPGPRSPRPARREARGSRRPTATRARPGAGPRRSRPRRRRRRAAAGRERGCAPRLGAAGAPGKPQPARRRGPTRRAPAPPDAHPALTRQATIPACRTPPRDRRRSSWSSCRAATRRRRCRSRSPRSRARCLASTPWSGCSSTTAASTAASSWPGRPGRPIVPLGRRRGLAAVFRVGTEEALRAGADVIVMFDADNQYCAGDLPGSPSPSSPGGPSSSSARGPSRTCPRRAARSSSLAAR